MDEQIPPLQRPPGFRTQGESPAKPAIRKPYVPPSYKPRRNRRSFCRRCCCFFCTLLTLIIFFALITCFVFYLWYEPKLPSFHLLSLKFPQFNITLRKDGTAHLNSDTLVKFEAVNPNTKLKVNYDQTSVKLSIGDDLNTLDLGEMVVPAFIQNPKNTTIMRIETKVKDQLIDDDFGKKMMRQVKSREVVMNVEVRTKIGIGLENYKIDKVNVKVICGDVTLKDLETGMAPKCTLNLLNWINIH